MSHSVKNVEVIPLTPSSTHCKRFILSLIALNPGARYVNEERAAKKFSESNVG